MKLFTKRILSLLLCAVLTLGLLPASALAASCNGDWPSFRGNAENNGVIDAETPTSPETAVLKWSQKYGTGWFSSTTPPLVLDDGLYIADAKRVLRLDKETGTVLGESPEMAGSVGFAMNPISCGGELLYVPIGNGQIQAVQADTLALSWVSDKLEGSAQAVSPLTYHNGSIYTGIWRSEEADGEYICLDAATGVRRWTLTHKGGFYWAGAYVTDQYLVVGSDDGSASNVTTDTATLYSLDPSTGAVIDQIDGIRGDIRSTVCYSDGKVYFATKGGWFCTVAVDEYGAFDHTTFQYVDLNGMCTGTPLVYHGRAYIGSSGASQFTDPGKLNVIDLTGEIPTLAYYAELPGYPQASALASSAYDDTYYVYITYNNKPGGIYSIADRAGQTEAEGFDLYIPTAERQNYCTCSLVCDSNGTLYYRNDSGYLTAVEHNAAYLTGLAADIGELKTPFATGMLSYELVVPKGTEAVTLTAQPCTGGTVTVNGGNASTPVVLTNGMATAEVAVMAEGDTRTYTLNIREISSNAALSGLAVNESPYFGTGDKTLLPQFDPAKDTYGCFGVEDTSVYLWPTVADPNATVKVYALANVDPSDIEADGTLDTATTSGGRTRWSVWFDDISAPMALRVDVTAEDGTSKESYTVLVTQTAAAQRSYATDLTLDQSELTLDSTSAKLTATPGVTVGEGEIETLTWRSSNEKVATVDENGNITCVGGGKTIITVAGALTSASCVVTCTTPLEIIVAVYDYTAGDAKLPGASANGIIVEQTTSAAYGAAPAKVFQNALTAAGVSYEMTGGYISSINGLAAGTGGGYSGWNFNYNHDDFSNMGLDSIVLSNGDRLEMHYSVNPDTTTDDVGNGWYGLPIVTSLTLAGTTATLGKETTWGLQGATTSYYLQDAQGTKTQLKGDGSLDSPFQLSLTLPKGTNLTALTAAYTTSLNSHYRVVEGLDGVRDYSKKVAFSIATSGGHYKTYYTLTATAEPDGGGSETPSTGISVSFRLIGSTRSTTDVDLGAGGYAGAQYQNWLQTDTYALPKGATVYDLFTTALDGAGLRYTGAEHNYVDTIYAPASLGGYALSEFSNGARSGWMFTINGVHPGYGLKDRVLKTGDSVVWHYVNDFSYEIADWFDGLNHPAMGDGTYFNAWLKVADTAPSANGSTDGGTAGGTSGGTALKPEQTVGQDGSVTVKFTADAVANAVAQAVKSGTSALVVEPKVTGTATKVSAVLPRMAASAAGRSGLDLTVKTSLGALSISAAALTALDEEKGDALSASIEKVQDKDGKPTGALRLEVAVDGKILTQIDGGITVVLPAVGAATSTVLVLVGDKETDVVKKSVVNGESLTALLAGSATVMVKKNQHAFSDVPHSYWGADAVDFATAHELFQGTGKDTFNPDGAMTRSMLATVLYRMENSPAVESTTDFLDVNSGTWYANAVAWCANGGIVTGTGTGFDPEGSVTREQLAVMLCRYAVSLGLDTASKDDKTSFKDADKVSPWAIDAVDWAVSCGILSGREDGTLDPSGSATRTEVATMLQRLVSLLVL